MDMTWQHNNPSNPADAKDGPQTYDDHLYYSFGVRLFRVHDFYALYLSPCRQGIADPNPTAYLTSICSKQPPSLLQLEGIMYLELCCMVQTSRGFRMLLRSRTLPCGLVNGPSLPTSRPQTNSWSSGPMLRSLCTVNLPDGS